MSKMLQEAIVDAEALKEAALRNAEMAIIEKYEAEIKDAVSVLLEEAPEDEFALGGDEMGMESDEEVADELIPAAADGEELCACPDVDGPEGGKVELDLDQLIATANAETGAEEEMDSDMGLTGGSLALEEEIDIDEGVLAKLIEELTSESEKGAPLKWGPPLAKYQKGQFSADSDDDEDPEFQADDDAPGEGRHASVKEDLKVDVSSGSSGWLGVTESEIERAVEEALASAQDSELAEENEELRKNIEELEEQVRRYSRRVLSLKEDRDKIKGVALKMRDHVEGVNLQNARLLYTNQVLTSDSLNERQKDQIVEAISKADSVDEAKVIFSTLQSAVGSNDKKAPKSLSEVVERRSSTLPRAQVSEAKKFDPVSDRMKLLAGIVKK